MNGLVWFRRGWGEGTIKITGISGTQILGGRWVIRGQMYQMAYCTRGLIAVNISIQDSHVYKGYMFKAPFPSPHRASALVHIPSTSAYGTWLWVILPNLAVSLPRVSLTILGYFCCHQWILNPIFNVRLKGFFCQTQIYYFLLAWCFPFLLPGLLLDALTLLRLTKKRLHWHIV